MTPEIWALLGQFGPLGLMIGYLVWTDGRKDQIARERAEADKALAAALAALTVTIQHLVNQVGK